ncbi:LIM and SH3 domain protein Lasp-like isoform X1 [Varroa jacobsoni]|uniref:LIM and SH3 domain protein Lasp-like isoform X1 n=1 Tax=Varroa jacobsoni TaxID=62625 RepID=UPI000BF63D31|nr:LIM and SH3 domain protein Lasp-like isoform X1 [Varroa jacobsoni]XP_022706849.1 LIM and SH3 domain protein Lasp-like isoform X1 [Varroa jacobsoni]XP_022706850.1 LIM and SH3 domain protein Lasp-like isoform X1 [Varroa jacobsoni]
MHLCAVCRRQVYPTEQLRVLNERYHKSCFRCSACGLLLTLRTYISRESVPFCQAHAPPLRSSAIVDTPVMQVAAKSQQLVSQFHYQRDLEEVIRGHALSVVDDIETMRVKKMGKLISDVSYTGILRRKKNMEEKRETTELVKRQSSSSFGTTALLYNAFNGRPVTLSNIEPNQEIGSIADFEPYYDEDEKPIYTLTRYVSGSSSNCWRNLIYHSNGSNTCGARSVDSSTPESDGSSLLPSRPTCVSTGRVYRAVYAYDAQDPEEVSFDEGDLLIGENKNGCTTIQSGWTTCTVQRTGRRGLAPAIYIKPV